MRRGDLYLSTGFAPSGWNTANGSFAFNRKVFTEPKGLIDVERGREVTRAVDLETMPIYVRAGAILPTGPVKQYTDEPVPADTPVALTIYPGADGSFLLYEDDGKTFDHRKGAWTGIELAWNDAARRLTARLAQGSRMLAPRRHLAVRVVGSADGAVKNAIFEGRQLTVTI